VAETQQDQPPAAWGVASDFGDARAEWHAARTACGVAEAPFRTRIVARGDDRQSFLHGMLSNDVKGLATGRGFCAAFLTDTAKVVTDLRVFAEEDRILLDCLAWRREALLAGLDRYLIADDVELEVPDDEQPLLLLEGPAAPDVLRAALSTAAPLPQEPYAHTRLDGLHVAVTSEVGGAGFLIAGPAKRRDALLVGCREAGAVLVGARALTSLRLEAGIPWAGVDMDESVLAMEIDLQSAISFTKGCYLGQETVERVAARGHVNRRRTVFRLAGDVVPALPCAVFADGREVGRITSAGYSFLRSGLLGLGLLHVKALESASSLCAGSGASSADCAPLALPLAADEPTGG